MTNRYVSYEATAAAYTSDTFTFTGARHNIDAISEELTPERNNIYPVTSKGRTPRRKLSGPLSWTGSIETLMYTKEAPSLLYYALGGHSYAVDSPVMGVNTHTVFPSTSIPDFILEIGRDDVAHRYTGVVATGFELSYDPDNPVTLKVDVNARKEQASGALASITFADFDSAERTCGGVEVVPKIGAAEGGTPTAYDYIESATVTYDNNFQDDAYVVGSQYLSGNFVNQVNCTGSFDISFIDSTEYFEVLSDTEKEFWLDMTHDTGANQRSIIAMLPRISYDTTSLPTTNAERYVQTLDFTANDNAQGHSIEIDVVNAQAEAAFIA